MQYGSYSPTKQFINTYLNLDGSRFTDKPGYEKDRIHRRVRESRLPPDANRPLPRPHSQEQRNGYPLCPRFRLLRDRLPADQVGDRRHESRQQHLALRHVDPDYSLRRNPADYAEAKCELDEFDETVWNETIKPSARTRRCRRNDARYGRSLHGRILPRHRHRHGIARNPPRTRNRTAARKLPLGRRHALGYGTAAGTPVVRGLCRRARQRSTIWTATVRTTSASCARSPNARRPA